MNRRIARLAAGLLMVVFSWLYLEAQGTARLEVRVTVVPAVMTTFSQEGPVTAHASQGAQFSWSGKQREHVVTRKATAAEIGNAWLTSVNPCDSAGTKVPNVSPNDGSCEMTIKTVEFVPE